MELVYIKLLTALSIFLLSVVTAFIPFKFGKHLQHQCKGGDNQRHHRLHQALSGLNCFAGGVFLATCLLDLLPEARETLEEALSKWCSDANMPVFILLCGTKPFTEALVVCGFLLILVIDQCTQNCRSRHSLVKASELKLEDHDEDPEEENNVDDESELSNGNVCIPDAIDVSTSKMIHQEQQLHQTQSILNCRHTILMKTSSQLVDHFVDVEDDESSESESSETNVLIPIAETQQAKSDNVSRQKEHPHHQHEETGSSFRSFALILALSVHSIFDGLAIGLQPAASLVLQVGLAIAVHKTIFAFSLGVRFARRTINESSSSSSYAVIYLGCFTLASPLGVLLGVIFDTVAAEFAWRVFVTGTLQALATGTLMYVTFFEVLCKEFNTRTDSTSSLVNISGFILGISVVLGTLALSE